MFLINVYSLNQLSDISKTRMRVPTGNDVLST